MSDSDRPNRRNRPTAAGEPPSVWAYDTQGCVERAGLDPLFAQFPATLWTTDHELRLTFVQGRLFHRMNVDAEAVLGRRLPDLLLDGREDHPLIHGHLAALGGSETSVRVEWGGEIYSARVAPLRDDTGTIIGCIGLNQVTEWVHDPNDTLRESDVRLRRVIDASVIGIVFVRDGNITDANDAFLGITGYSVEELTTGQIEWTALTPMNRQHEHMQALRTIRNDGRVDATETQLLRKNGTRVDVIVSGVRLSARRREAVGFVMDISAQKRRLRRAAGELACARTLIGAADRAGALATWLRTACDRLEWTGAALWLGDQDRAPIAHNVTAGHQQAIASLLPDACIVKQSIIADAVAAFVVPLVDTVSGAFVGAVAFTRPQGPVPDDELFAVTQSTADQLVDFLRA